LLACWRARAINEKFLRVSKLALVAKQAWFSGHYGRTWIDHNENGLLRNVIEESQSSSPGFLPSLPDEGDLNSGGLGLTVCSLLVAPEAKTGKVHYGGVFIEKKASPNEWQIWMESRS